jgi:hypothetical protein
VGDASRSREGSLVDEHAHLAFSSQEKRATRRRVRRTLLIGVSALAVALAAVAATRSATEPKRQADCRQTLLIVLFWPKGHGAIRSVGFHADRKPHVEIYKYGTHGYPTRNFLVYGAANQSTRFSKTCKATAGQEPSGTIRRRITARKARAFSCRMPSGGVVQTKPIRNGLEIDLGAPRTRVVSAKLHPHGSTFDFSRQWCNPGDPPS